MRIHIRKYALTSYELEYTVDKVVNSYFSCEWRSCYFLDIFFLMRLSNWLISRVIGSAQPVSLTRSVLHCPKILGPLEVDAAEPCGS